ncbi:maleylacetoacetate isomerase [Erythrobacteraceae bacterium CFH 75059]|uniref:maleylacetoacetate isomerase n=1 Tax=Qipengyuania thermophila TaxID=2509361 RepID=UPI00102075FC|nr:maleylacetoacetate isomerase [Qipengyuania thermophila]TCD06380.1 maleylacetoacetate isomerase [Erythrobacteraceae bacterium CFH 75059]
MKLHGYYRSSTTYRLRIALELKGLAYTVVPVNLLEQAHKALDFTARNPFGSVPVLEVDGRWRAQSLAILEWLEEEWPQPPLLPAGGEARFVTRELAYAIATELHAPLNLPVLRYLKEPLGHAQDEIDTYYRHVLARTLTPVEQRLERLDTGDFLHDAPGLFEAVLVPQLYNARRFAYPVDDHPRLARIEAACLDLPAFRRAHPDVQPDNPAAPSSEKTTP